MNVNKLKDRPEFGSFAAIAAICGVSREAARKWIDLPVEHCPAIEGHTGGAIRCEDLRPDIDWQLGHGIDAQPIRRMVARTLIHSVSVASIGSTVIVMT